MLMQIFQVILLNLKTIPERVGASLVIVVGIAGVVGVFTALFAMAGGIDSTLQASGERDNALVMRGGSQAELNSSMSRETYEIIGQAPGVRKNAEGEPVTSGEIIVIAELPKKGSTLGANITLRGIGAAGLTLRPKLKIIEGRQYTPGLQELLVGKGAAEQFSGLEVGNVVRLRGADWTVVGIFESGDAFDSEIFTDLATAQTAWSRGSSLSVTLVGLESEDSLAAFDAALKADPRLSVDAQRQSDYYSAQTGSASGGVRILGGAVAIIMGLGAIFAALNTMYASVSGRTREIATLRAIGFGPLPVVSSVLAESMLLAVCGGLIGALVAYVFFNGMSVSTLGNSTFTQLVFNFQVTPALVMRGMILALAVGFFGGLLPALRAARMPVTTALREA
ncbi:ABC transporter permease [Pseudomarimonas arenosa]|uniref:FtsX-like permease family protein n=1 Tax=Pseudomarimonas arenosa TaxID=2774145 RepID=A0AAW3ZPJ7_9GAMM|nr:ABC transporter permease [Pseudomarimonas arenosa]MBD8528108.1 FtsX-like permease family protein [Pseudomarimonas arenosa]